MSLRKQKIIRGFIILLLGFPLTACSLAQQPAAHLPEDVLDTKVPTAIQTQPADEETSLPAIITENSAIAETISTPAPPEPGISPLAIAFVSPELNAYYWNESLSSAVLLTTTGDIQETIVSPDGSQVLLIRSGDWVNYQVDLINADGTGLRTLLTPADFDLLPRPEGSLSTVPAHIAWIPRSNQIAMTTQSYFEGPGSQTGQHLYIIDPDSGRMSALLSIPEVWRWDFTYSPDGSKLLISKPEGVDLYSRDGNLLYQDLITYPFVNTASDYAWIANPSWSMDGTSVIIVVPPQEPWEIPMAESSIWYWNENLPAAKLIGEEVMRYQATGLASTSPDLAKVLYLAPTGTDEAPTVTLKLFDMVEMSATNIAEGEIYTLPSWSTDGSQFYYHDQSSGSYIVAVDGAAIRLADFSNANTAVWVDESRLVGASGPEGGWRLLLGGSGITTQVIYSSGLTDNPIRFSVNR
ncbi:MAG: hypothetical protein KBG10_05840 [Anaerolineaceae bacterium]|nr:hypothetical protein [Anaerolineaceae bacterium]